MADEFTDKLVESLEKPATGNRVYYDKLVKGFGVRVTSADARAFILNYRIDGRERRITIGSYPDWKVKKARDHAKTLKCQIDLGKDPMQVREDARQAKTVGQLCDTFLEEAVPKRRAKTQTDYKAIIKLYIRPWWGNLKAAALTQSDVTARHRELAKRAPTRANRVLALTATIFNYAGLENPTKGVEREHEERRERFLSTAEIARLADALAAHPEKSSANAIRLLLLTGARRGETLAAEWSEFDLEAGTWTKPSGHTKQKKLHKIPLSPPAVEILTEMKTVADAVNKKRDKEEKPPLKHLFPGKDGHPITDIKHSWATICEKAGLGGYVQAKDENGKLLFDKKKQPIMEFVPNARLHDLRHSFASVLVSSGLNLPVVGALLGHTQSKTTQRYAHLHNSALADATAIMGAVFTAAKKPEPPKTPEPTGGNVVAFTGGQKSA